MVSRHFIGKNGSLLEVENTKPDMMLQKFAVVHYKVIDLSNFELSTQDNQSEQSSLSE